MTDRAGTVAVCSDGSSPWQRPKSTALSQSSLSRVQLRIPFAGVPFALAASLSGAVDSTALIITAGLAEVAAGAIPMGLGAYLAARSVRMASGGWIP
jgi:hypothetical protein